MLPGCEPHGQCQGWPHGGAVHQGPDPDAGGGGRVGAGRVVPVHQEADGGGGEDGGARKSV